MGLIDNIKERLAQREANDLKDGLKDLYEDSEKGRKNLDGSTTLENHDFRMPQCMPSNVRIFDRIWKNDVEIFLETTWNTIKDLMRADYQLSPEVKELKDVFDRLKKVEGGPNGRRRWEIIGGLLCFLLEFDLAYRWRMKWALKDFDWSKWDYTPEDAYWLSKRVDVPPPEKEWSEQYCVEWQKKNYGEVLWGED